MTRKPPEELPAWHLSTHAIKTELAGLLHVLAPDKKWPKRAGVVEMSDFALHSLDPESTDARTVRARELASVMYFKERR